MLIKKLINNAIKPLNIIAVAKKLQSEDLIPSQIEIKDELTAYEWWFNYLLKIAQNENSEWGIYSGCKEEVISFLSFDKSAFSSKEEFEYEKFTELCGINYHAESYCKNKMSLLLYA